MIRIQNRHFGVADVDGLVDIDHCDVFWIDFHHTSAQNNSQIKH